MTDILQTEYNIRAWAGWKWACYCSSDQAESGFQSKRWLHVHL